MPKMMGMDGFGLELLLEKAWIRFFALPCYPLSKELRAIQNDLLLSLGLNLRYCTDDSGGKIAGNCRQQ